MSDRSCCFLFRSQCFLFILSPFSCLLYKLGFISHWQDYNNNMAYVFPNTSLVNKINVYFLVIDVSQLAKYHDSWEVSNARVVSLDSVHCLLLSLLIFCTCKPKVSVATGVLPGVLGFFLFFFLTSEKLRLGLLLELLLFVLGCWMSKHGLKLWWKQ